MRKIILLMMMALPLMAAAQTTAPMGILVTQRQGTVDWTAVHEQNDLDFVYVMTTYGAAKTDERCGTNLERAFSAGFPVGCVHRYDRHYSAQGQMDNYKAAVKGHHLDLLPVVYVVADGYDINVKRLDMLLQLMEEEYGVKPMIMANQEAYLKYFSLERYAAYHVMIVSNGLKFPSTRYTVWEYTDREQITGIVEYTPGLKLHGTYKLEDIKL
ncbi:MAG: glycoside hydrolase family 25 protein [Bacteroidales bacterium]|nr:glycoside hydrolase family 25 protein [Bacteroidales bacterium]